jgi:DNA-binding CsgD family transcriptional regulator
METLSSDNYRKILKAIEILGSAGDFASLPGRALTAIMAAIDVDFASYSEVDLATGHNRFLVKPELNDMEIGSLAYERFIRRFGNHPILAYQLSSGLQAGGAADTFLKRIRLLGMVGNCCGDAELLLDLELPTERPGRRMIGISINRSIRDFDENDGQCLHLLKPHLIAARRNAVESDEAGAKRPTETVGDFPLTERENEVLYWVSMGKTNEEVGEIIGAKRLTVKKHLEHIYDKLGVPNRTAAARMLGEPVAIKGAPG